LVEDTEEEKTFRVRYADELKKKRKDGTDSDIEAERNKVKHQGMKTPGRRGEQIKHEEIDKEIVRRYTAGLEKEKQKKSNEKSGS
jgi:hypothetical protein